MPKLSDFHNFDKPWDTTIADYENKPLRVSQLDEIETGNGKGYLALAEPIDDKGKTGTPVRILINTEVSNKVFADVKSAEEQGEKIYPLDIVMWKERGKNFRYWVIADYPLDQEAS